LPQSYMQRGDPTNMNITIKVPATSANLGPGFDALGLALDLWNESTVELADDFSVYVEGEGNGKLALGKNNMIVRAAHKLAERAGKELPPLGSGMGWSAEATLTGLLAANVFTDAKLSQDELLSLATELEGHPDNVAPALMGGLVVSTMQAEKVLARKLPIAPLHVTVVLPDFHFPTKEARNSLPKQVDIKDAVHNIGRTVLVTEAFRTGDLSLLGEAMTDKLHQPYRLKLIPGAAAAMEAAREAGAAAVALSGAGPSLIAFSSKADTEVGASMKSAFQSIGLNARVFALKVCDEGVVVQTQE
jgi:homoserine kinase